jgi:hypothetical protein
MLPFEYFLPQKKEVAPSIIGKQIFKFVIFGWANI